MNPTEKSPAAAAECSAIAVAQLVHAVKTFIVGQETVTALQDVTLQGSAGQLVCIYGASGSGKTTLLNVLAGIETVDSGEVLVTGKPVSGRSEQQRADLRLHNIGIIFQSNNLLPELDAGENVALPLLVRGIDRATAHRAVDAALASVGLAALARRRPAQMSGGQRQRTGIARALAGGQALLLADEPTGALDSANSRELFSILRTQCDEHGTAVVLATHDPLAQEYADAVLDIVDGAVAAR